MANWFWVLILMIVLVGCGGGASVQPTAVPSAVAATATTATISNPQTSAQMLEFIRQHAANTSMVSYSTNSDGSINQADPVIQFNAEMPLPLASTMKIVVLASYAQAVEAGTLDPEEPIALADWELWYWPNTDGGAHPAALKRLEIPADQRGFASDPQKNVPLKTLAQAMIFESDNAATDYLIDRLGMVALDQTIETLGMQQQTNILPIMGLFLLVMNPDAPIDSSTLQSVLDLDQASIEQQVLALAERYKTEAAWRETVRNQGQLTLTLAEQGQIFSHIMPKGSANDYAKLMSLVGNNQLISSAVSQTMREYLEWPMTIPGNEAMFKHFGTKGGSLPAILTEAMFVQPAKGEWADRTRVVVLFFNQLPDATWLGLLQTFMQQQFAVQVALEPAFAQSVASQLK